MRQEKNEEIKKAQDKAYKDAMEHLGLLTVGIQTKRGGTYRNIFISGWQACMDYRTNGNHQQADQPDSSE